ncbi:MAG: glycosyltransferase family 2 protein [Lachnospiraceae bacterium]|jgi:glycosyltransferase involved in cell wall biosynthesis|nr:glycosyltransferase family 2 protein [Lachnospiraceae bacterium]
MKKISLFTPCYNEEGNLYDMYTRVTEVMKTLPQYEYEYVLIDNCSTDKTPEILRKIAAEDKRVKVIFNLKNFGPSRSGSHGFFQTSGDVSICFACDFQDPPELIPEFVKKWEQGAKVVWGKKEGSDENKIMYAIRCLYYKIIKGMAENEQYENVTGFGLYDKEVLDLLRKYAGPTPNFRNMISEFGYSIEFVMYHQPKRKSGHSSYNLFKYMNVALNDMVNTSKLPLRVATFIGAIVAVISFLIALYYLILKLIFWESYDIGMATLVIGLFFIGAVQIMFVGIVGEYVGEILTRMNDRPLVIERERLNFDEDEEQ